MGLRSTHARTLWVHDGESPTGFLLWKAVTSVRLQITRQLMESTAIRSNSWMGEPRCIGHEFVVTVDAVASDEPAAQRIRTLALTEAASAFRLGISVSETVDFSGIVALYEEVAEAANLSMTRVQIRGIGAIAIDAAS